MPAPQAMFHHRTLRPAFGDSDNMLAAADATAGGRAAPESSKPERTRNCYLSQTTSFPCRRLLVPSGGYLDRPQLWNCVRPVHGMTAKAEVAGTLDWTRHHFDRPVAAVTGRTFIPAAICDMAGMGSRRRCVTFQLRNTKTALDSHATNWNRTQAGDGSYPSAFYFPDQWHVLPKGFLGPWNTAATRLCASATRQQREATARTFIAHH